MKLRAGRSRARSSRARRSNGARGVIINVTGGPDLSLIEVSEASSIVQEAADEDANIIFGAVVDPALKGKVKITVIATGFGAYTSVSRPGRAARTPVDMTPYGEASRMRADMPAAAAAPALTLRRQAAVVRRPVVDMLRPSPGRGSCSSQRSDCR